MCEMNSNINIRKATFEDLKKLWDLDSKAFKNEPYPFFFFRQAIELFPYTFYIAEIDNKIIGFCIGSSVTGDNSKGWILSMAVDKNFRGKGIGTKLLNKIIKELSRLNCHEIFLSVHPKNISAKMLYEKKGFKKIIEDENYFGKGNPRYIMSLILVGGQ